MQASERMKVPTETRVLLAASQIKLSLSTMDLAKSARERGRWQANVKRVATFYPPFPSPLLLRCCYLDETQFRCLSLQI